MPLGAGRARGRPAGRLGFQAKMYYLRPLQLQSDSGGHEKPGVRRGARKASVRTDMDKIEQILTGFEDFRPKCTTCVPYLRFPR